MKPFHATTTQKRTHISRCPCCRGKYGDSPKAGKSRARQDGQKEVKRQMESK